MHSIQFAKPSLVCDIKEIFRSLIDNFLINYSQQLREENFELKGERIFLKQKESCKLIKSINEFLKVDRAPEGITIRLPQILK